MLRNGYVGDFGPEFLAGTAEYERRDSLQNPVPRGVPVRPRPPAPSFSATVEGGDHTFESCSVRCLSPRWSKVMALGRVVTPSSDHFIYVELAKAVTQHTVLARRADPRKMRTRIGYPGRANFE